MNDKIVCTVHVKTDTSDLLTHMVWPCVKQNSVHPHALTASAFFTQNFSLLTESRIQTPYNLALPDYSGLSIANSQAMPD